MDREEVERQWFLKVVTVMMLAALIFGATPIVKSVLFPAEKSSR